MSPALQRQITTKFLAGSLQVKCLETPRPLRRKALVQSAQRVISGGVFDKGAWMTGVHGILLTGGSSARMGSPKALLEIGGETLARKAARALSAVAEPVVAVGMDAGLDLEHVDDPQLGPLWALRVGCHRLEEMGEMGPVLLLGCDLPLVTAGLLALLAEQLDGYGAAVPVVEGRAQPVAACYGPAARARLASLGPVPRATDFGSMKDMLDGISVKYVHPDVWRSAAADDALFDVNTPADLERVRQVAGRTAR